MHTQEIIAHLRPRFAEEIVETVSDGAHQHIAVRREQLRDVCSFLKTEPALWFDLLRCITAVDWPAKNRMELSYDLLSIRHAHSFALKVLVERAQPVVDSVSDIWPAANWHEREAYDLMGISFTNHPDLRRILMPDDWHGHPLRKDYQDPTDYHGLKIKP